MEVINYSSLRENLKQVLDSVVEDKSNYIINRGKESAVLMSLDESNGWKETLYLLAQRTIEIDCSNQLKGVKRGNF